MIRIDPVYLLLLIELICILSGCIVFLVLRNNKYRRLYQNSLKEVMNAAQAEEELQKKLAAAQKHAVETTAASPQAASLSGDGPSDASDGIALRAELQGLQEELKEKTNKMEQLQAKFSDLEKEYMVLYQQQQQNQQG